MTRNFITIGQDSKPELTIKDKAGLAINLATTYEGYALFLYYRSETEPFAKYSKNAVTGYLTDLDTTDEATGVIRVNLKRSITSLGIDNKDVYLVFAPQAADADFEDSHFKPMSKPTYFFTYTYAPVDNTGDLNP